MQSNVFNFLISYGMLLKFPLHKNKLVLTLLKLEHLQSHDSLLLAFGEGHVKITIADN